MSEEREKERDREERERDKDREGNSHIASGRVSVRGKSPGPQTGVLVLREL